MTDLTSVQPTVAESNLIFKLFFKSVNPFIRVLHHSYFERELDNYRRGSLAFPLEFEALLFSIHTLTINSLSAGVVERTFSTQKQLLLTRFKNAAQVALLKVEFFKTDKITTIHALLHYLVSISTYLLAISRSVE